MFERNILKSVASVVLLSGLLLGCKSDQTLDEEKNKALESLSEAVDSVPTAAKLEGPVEFILPFKQGGEFDASAQILKPVFADKLGREMNISYQSGGNGSSTWASLNQLNGDGQTIMGVSYPHVVMQPELAPVGYTADEINTVFIYNFTPDALIVAQESRYTFLDDLLADAKEVPGAVTFAGAGVASSGNLTQLKFDRLAGVSTNYLAVNGTNDVINTLLAEDAEAAWVQSTVATQLGRKVRILAVAMEERHQRYPEVPTFKELGYDLVGGNYRGIALPKSATEDTKNFWSNVMLNINVDPRVRDQMLGKGFVPVDITIEKMPEFLNKLTTEYLQDARSTGLSQ